MRAEMSNIPYFSLRDFPEFEIDAELVRQIPRKLAYYHLVLPLSAEGSELSLAMAEPDSPLVIDMLEHLLNATIVPVHSPASEIREVLDRVWRYIPISAPQFLIWESSLHVHQMAQHLRQIFPASILDLQHEDQNTLLLYTQDDKTALAVIDAAKVDVSSLIPLIREAASPLFLLRGDLAPERYFRRIMLALRGHAPDLSALDWVIPLVTTHHSELSLLAVTPPPRAIRTLRLQHSLAAFLDPKREPAQHLAECTQRLDVAGIQGYLKLCQGDPFVQIQAEFSTGEYSLLVIVSEAYGEFVANVLQTIQEAKHPHAVLIVKPTLNFAMPS